MCPCGYASPTADRTARLASLRMGAPTLDSRAGLELVEHHLVPVPDDRFPRDGPRFDLPVRAIAVRLSASSARARERRAGRFQVRQSTAGQRPPIAAAERMIASSAAGTSKSSSNTHRRSRSGWRPRARSPIGPDVESATLGGHDFPPLGDMDSATPRPPKSSLLFCRRNAAAPSGNSQISMLATVSGGRSVSLDRRPIPRWPRLSCGCIQGEGHGQHASGDRVMVRERRMQRGSRRPLEREPAACDEDAERGEQRPEEALPSIPEGMPGHLGGRCRPAARGNVASRTWPPLQPGI